MLDLGNLSEDALLNVRELAKVLSCCTRTVEARLAKQELPSPFRMGGRRYWRAGHLKKFFDELQSKMAAEDARVGELRKKQMGWS